ncbi:MAG: hypothetical protein KAS07_02570 [Candidatus Pacebacteria bacterium]|nr:hypothetical protein [Candidatus Paceibacterota bacterium]
MAEDIEKIKHIASQYTLLTKREEIDFITVLHRSTPQDVKNLRNLFEEDPRWVAHFYENYQTKRRALQQRDTNAWDRIIEKEVQEYKLFGA